MKRELLIIAAAGVWTTMNLGLPADAQLQRNQQARQQRSEQQQEQLDLQAEALQQQLREVFSHDAVSIPGRDPIEMKIAGQQLVRDALQPGQLTQALTQLSRVNRNELGKVSAQRQQQLDLELQTFGGTFQAKYGEPLALDRNELFPYVALVRADVKDASALGNLPLRPMAARGGSRDATAGNETTDQHNARQTSQTYGTDAKTYGIKNGSKLALMGVPIAGGGQNLVITAVEESRPAANEMAGEWRLIIPLGVTGDVLAENIAQHIYRTREQVNQWPADAQAMREQLAQRVIMALYNLDPAARPNTLTPQQRQAQQEQREQQRLQQQRQDAQQNEDQPRQRSGRPSKNSTDD